MNFLKTVGNSIHSPHFYSTLPKKTFKQSFGYFFLLILLLTIIHVLTLVNPLLIEAPTALVEVTQSLVNCLPPDLEIKVTKGQASINQEEPYFIPPCMEGWDNSSVVIDTKTPYSPDKFEEYGAAAWMTKDEIVYRRDKVETRTYSLKQMGDFTLTRTVAQSFYQKFLPYVKFVGPALLLLAFLGIYLFYSLRLIHLLIIALITWLLSKSFNKNLSYGNSYKIGIYALTLGLVVDLVVTLTQRWTNFHGFPFMVTILTLSVILVNVLLPKKSSLE